MGADQARRGVDDPGDLDPGDLLMACEGYRDWSRFASGAIARTFSGTMARLSMISRPLRGSGFWWRRGGILGSAINSRPPPMPPPMPTRNQPTR